MLGNRNNSGKRRWHLLMWDAVEAIVDVLEFGASKYGARNWENGMSYSQTFDSMQRHAIAWFNGEDIDKESGLSHMAHASWNALVILAFTLRGRADLDDRPSRQPEQVK